MNADSLIGRDIDGRLTVIERLNAGGMGVVYRAKHNLLHTMVALKVIHPSLAMTEDIRRRFLREARAGSSISDPRIVSVRDAGEIDGQLYFTMDLVEGKTIQEVLAAEGPMGTPRAVGIAVQVLRALEAAHGKGIIHRDLKPGNVMLEEGDSVKVLDFGLAKWIGPNVSGSTEGLTMTGHVVGTLGYMAPEQITGDTVDVRTDLYALCVIFYELLTGRRPHNAKSGASLLRQIVLEDPEPLQGPVGEVVMRGLSRDADDRPASAAELRALLEAAAAGLPAEHKTGVQTLVTALAPVAQEAASAPPVPRARRRSRRLVLLLLTLGLLLVTCALYIQGAFDETIADRSSSSARRDVPIGAGTGRKSTDRDTAHGDKGAGAGAAHAARTPPVVRITSPEAGAYLANATVQVRGTVQFLPPGARVVVNGQAADLSPDRGDTERHFGFALADLADGELEIEALVDGAEGSRVTRRVILDRVRPVISVARSGEVVRVAPGSELHLGGRVTERSLAELTAWRTTSSSEGSPVRVPVDADGSFTYAVRSLSDEEFVVTFDATDRAGNEARPVTVRFKQEKRVAVPTWAKVSKEQIAAARTWGVPVAIETDLGGGESLRFVLIPAGTFTMGSPADEPGRGEDEQRHAVRLTKPFYMQTTEITNAQYRRWKSKHRSSSSYEAGLDGLTQPAVEVSYDAIVGSSGEGAGFLGWINERPEQPGLIGLQFRLPTEAEWEYACRAGSETRYPWGDSMDDARLYANLFDVGAPPEKAAAGTVFPRNDGHRITAPVGSYRPNGWGLHDMLGNVWEWCSDWWDKTYYPASLQTDPLGPSKGRFRVLRGGSRLSGPSDAGSARRTPVPPDASYADDGFDGVGFRLVATLPSQRHRRVRLAVAVKELGLSAGQHAELKRIGARTLDRTCKLLAGPDGDVEKMRRLITADEITPAIKAAFWETYSRVKPSFLPLVTIGQEHDRNVEKLLGEAKAASLSGRFAVIEFGHWGKAFDRKR